MVRFRSMGSSLSSKGNGDADPRRRRQLQKKRRNKRNNNKQQNRPCSRGFPEGIPPPACRPVTPTEEVWRGLAARHQLMLEKLPRKDFCGGESDVNGEDGKARGAPSHEVRAERGFVLYIPGIVGGVFCCVCLKWNDGGEHHLVQAFWSTDFLDLFPRLS